MTMTQVSDPPPQSGALAQATAIAAGPPALIAGESAAAYEELLLRVANALQPADVLEEIWIRDVVDLVWEASRLRRLKARVIAVGAYEGMEEVLKPLVANDTEARESAKKWAAGDAAAQERVARAMEKAGLTMDSVPALTLAVHLPTFERLDRMIMAAEARRAAALNELDRHRQNFALRLRGALHALDRPQVGAAPVAP